jgi:hypothetical protein
MSIPDVNLLRHFQRIVDFDAEVTHSTVSLGVTQQKLDCLQVLSLLSIARLNSARSRSLPIGCSIVGLLIFVARSRYSAVN